MERRLVAHQRWCQGKYWTTTNAANSAMTGTRATITVQASNGSSCEEMPVLQVSSDGLEPPVRGTARSGARCDRTPPSSRPRHDRNIDSATGLGTRLTPVMSRTRPGQVRQNVHWIDEVPRIVFETQASPAAGADAWRCEERPRRRPGQGTARQGPTP